MSAFKKLNQQDVFVTSYTAKKRWTLSGSELETAGIRFLPAYSSLTDCTFTITAQGFVPSCEFTISTQTYTI